MAIHLFVDEEAVDEKSMDKDAVDEESRSRDDEAEDEKADDEEDVDEENVGEEAVDEDAGIPLTLTDFWRGWGQGEVGNLPTFGIDGGQLIAHIQ